MNSIETDAREPQLGHLKDFCRAVPMLVDNWMRSDECTPGLRTAVGTLRREAQNETPEGELLILRALDLAIASYQFNADTSSRFRKVIVPGMPPEPYSIHPVEVALHSLGQPTRLRVSIDGQTWEHEARQEPYDARVIAAKLLHDCIEDVKKIQGFGEIPGTDGWKWLIKTYLESGTGRSPELDPRMIDDVLCMVLAVTKPSKKEVEKMRPVILQDPHTAKVVRHFQRFVPPDERDAVADQIVGTVAVHHTILNETMGNDFARIGAIDSKVTDNVHNMRTGVKFGKLSGVHENTEWARSLELPIATIALFGLVDNAYDTSEMPGSPNDSFHAKKMRRAYIEVENDRYRRREKGMPMPQMHFAFPGAQKRRSYEISANQIPVTTQAERRDSVRSDPALQHVVPITDLRLLERLREERGLVITYDESRAGFPARRVYSPLHDEIGLAIFESLDPTRGGQTAFYTKFIDGTRPTGTRVLMRGSTAEASKVPGMRIMSSADGTLAATLRVCEALSPLR